MDFYLHIGIFGLFIVMAIYVVISSNIRKPTEVLHDLLDEASDNLSNNPFEVDISASVHNDNLANSKAVRIGGYILNDQLADAGLLTDNERKRYLLIKRITPIISGFVFALAGSFFFNGNGAMLVISSLIGVGVGYYWEKVSFRNRIKDYKKRISFYLPQVMERVVMAVQAGLDIIPAIDAANQFASDKRDPVTRLLKIVHNLCESGLTFEKAVNDVSKWINHSGLRHAFLHMGQAHREGGEIVLPLRELSDAMQLYYQESVEEEIAELPVKATMPLVCTFAGLLICFLTPALVYVIKTIIEITPT